VRILAQNLLTFLLSEAYSSTNSNQEREAKFVKECGLDWLHADQQGDAYLSVKSKLKNIEVSPIQQGRQRQWRLLHSVAELSTMRWLRTRGSGTRTETGQGAQFKNLEITENRTRIILNLLIITYICCLNSYFQLTYYYGCSFLSNLIVVHASCILCHCVALCTVCV
jgi:hypothetical protein